MARGLEQMLIANFPNNLNSINSISPFRNGGANFKAYIDAAYDFIKQNPNKIDVKIVGKTVDDLYETTKIWYTAKTGKLW